MSDRQQHIGECQGAFGAKARLEDRLRGLKQRRAAGQCCVEALGPGIDQDSPLLRVVELAGDLPT